MRRADEIVLKGVRLRAPAGDGARTCSVDVRLRLDLMEAACHDRIDRTVDYRQVHRRLREAAAACAGDLADSLAQAVLDGFPQVEEVEIEEAGGRRLRRQRTEGSGAAR